MTEGPKPDPVALGALLAMAGIAPELPRRAQDPAGHACEMCSKRLGHEYGCVQERAEKFARHVEHCKPCSTPTTCLDERLLCPRGRRLLEAIKPMKGPK